MKNSFLLVNLSNCLEIYFSYSSCNSKMQCLVLSIRTIDARTWNVMKMNCYVLLVKISWPINKVPTIYNRRYCQIISSCMKVIAFVTLMVHGIIDKSKHKGVWCFGCYSNVSFKPNNSYLFNAEFLYKVRKNARNDL